MDAASKRKKNVKEHYKTWWTYEREMKIITEAKYVCYSYESSGHFSIIHQINRNYLVNKKKYNYIWFYTTLF